MCAFSGQLPGRTALVLYGSETGNAQEVAEELGRMTERLRFTTQVSDLNSVNLGQLLRHSVVLIAISTTGQGDLPANAQSFWRTLRSVRLRPGCLQAVRFTTFGLGDSSYPKFNWAHRKLRNRIVQLGGQPICDRGEADEQHPEGLDGSFLPWSLSLRERLLDRYPLPDGVEPIPDDVLLEPKWILELASPEEGTAAAALVNGTCNGTSNGDLSDKATDHAHDQSLGADTPPEDLLPIPGSITATLISNDRITPPTHWQDVRHLTLTTSTPTSYAPGDVLTIYPKNFPSDVTTFLNLMHWTPIADAPLKLVSTSPLTPSTPYPPPPIPLPSASTTGGAPLTLRTLLTNNLDILSIPRRSFFSAISHFTPDPFHKARLLEFTDPALVDELYDYTTRPRRSILEVLQEFDSVRIPWQRALGVLPVMRGRQFSIASGGRLKRAPPPPAASPPPPAASPAAAPAASAPAPAPHPGQAQTRIELLIAIVKYRTIIKRLRQGVATRYISALRPGCRLSVTLSRGGLHISRAEASRPVVMVGPGTGVAPMRALTWERRAWWEEGRVQGVGMGMGEGVEGRPPVRDVLFFGCRNERADFFFREEWDNLREEGDLDVFAAFSRDQRHKVYVQDLVRQQAKRVYEALGLHNGLVYICGSSGKMPQAVREALIEVFQGEGGLDRGNAEAYLLEMEKEGRYKQETW